MAKKRNIRTALNVNKRFGLEAFSEIRGIGIVVTSKYGFPRLSKALPRRYHSFLRNGFYTDVLIKKRSTKSE